MINFNLLSTLDNLDVISKKLVRIKSYNENCSQQKIRRTTLSYLLSCFILLYAKGNFIMRIFPKNKLFFD